MSKSVAQGRVLALVAALSLTACGGGLGSPDLGPDPADAHPALPDLVYGVTPSGLLVSFTANAPGVVVLSAPLTGLQVEEHMVGIDVYPGTTTLFGVSDKDRVYTVNRFTGEATMVGASSFTPGLVGDTYAVGIDPVTRQIAVLTDAGQNLRVSPTTGAVVAAGVPLAYGLGDPAQGAPPALAAGAYTNSTPSATSTSLFALDTAQGTLVRLPAPQFGTVETVGTLGLDVSDVAGFDITGSSNRAYAALNVRGTAFSAFFQVSLATGALSYIGQVGVAEPLRAIAVIPAVP